MSTLEKASTSVGSGSPPGKGDQDASFFPADNRALVGYGPEVAWREESSLPVTGGYFGR